MGKHADSAKASIQAVDLGCSYSFLRPSSGFLSLFKREKEKAALVKYQGQESHYCSHVPSKGAQWRQYFSLQRGHQQRLFSEKARLEADKGGR